MPLDAKRRNELKTIREVCENLGVDEDMTSLVLGSHRYNRGPLDNVLTDGGELIDYVLKKMAIWKAIFNE
jgi:hypothetical protein